MNDHSPPLMSPSVTDADFEAEVLQSDLPVFVDFWAPWCGPCRAMAPVVDELTEDNKGKLKIVKLNVDESPLTAEKFGVMSIPTFIIFKGGSPVKNFVGAQSKAGVQKIIDEAIS